MMLTLAFVLGLAAAASAGCQCNKNHDEPLYSQDIRLKQHRDWKLKVFQLWDDPEKYQNLTELLGYNRLGAEYDDTKQDYFKLDGYNQCWVGEVKQVQLEHKGKSYIVDLRMIEEMTKKGLTNSVCSCHAKLVYSKHHKAQKRSADRHPEPYKPEPEPYQPNPYKPEPEPYQPHPYKAEPEPYHPLPYLPEPYQPRSYKPEPYPQPHYYEPEPYSPYRPEPYPPRHHSAPYEAHPTPYYEEVDVCNYLIREGTAQRLGGIECVLAGGDDCVY